MKQYQARCNVCPATITPDAPCEHLTVNELGQVYKVHPVHQFEPEPMVVAKLVTVTSDADYQGPNVAPKSKDQS